MASFDKSRLTPLQQDVLCAFFALDRGFFLTGGGALVGFDIAHRTTDDLDLFTLDEAAFERSRHVLPELARKTSCEISVRVEAPAFRRWALTRGSEALIVDTVLDRSTQRVPTKPTIDGVTLDPPEEIIANKLAAIVGRSEERDLVDLMALEKAGYAVEPALPAALAKDGGATPAAIAWLLSEIVIPDDARLPGVTPIALRAYIADLVRRLRAVAHPA